MRRILLILPQFYGVEIKIKSLLEESGDEVILIENRNLPLDYHGSRSKLKILRRIYFFLFSPQVRYLKSEFRKIGDLRFDILFTINGFIVCPYLIRKLKKENKNLFSVLYLWDSSAMYSWRREIRLFDKVHSFDRVDSEKFNIGYKPNFFVRPPVKNDNIQKYDLFFLGKFTSDRLSISTKIINKARQAGLKYFIKLWPAYKGFMHYRSVYNVFRIFRLKDYWINEFLLNYEANENKIKGNILINSILDHEDVQKLSVCSNVILDIPYQWQDGYTHRMIEALATGKKVITTNSAIKKESFYNPEQVRVLNSEEPEIDIDWIKEIRTFPVDDYFSSLELSVWLKSILNIEIKANEIS